VKKIISVVVALCLLLSLAPSVLADSHNVPPVKSYSEDQYTKSDIMKLEKYVSVQDGYFVLDYKKAKTDGFSADMLNGQKEYFKY
ncbi:hypothetical protein, partial [Paraburkholderia sp. SIMBA_027]|uniref:hypothetical protein n=1 Tax=Paraburkholderia sp. SIMBA_027 TaxID=3085770 RepID=UPI00397CD08A